MAPTPPAIQFRWNHHEMEQVTEELSRLPIRTILALISTDLRAQARARGTYIWQIRGQRCRCLWSACARRWSFSGSWRWCRARTRAAPLCTPPSSTRARRTKRAWLWRGPTSETADLQSDTRRSTSPPDLRWCPAPYSRPRRPPRSQGSCCYPTSYQLRRKRRFWRAYAAAGTRGRAWPSGACSTTATSSATRCGAWTAGRWRGACRRGWSPCGGAWSGCARSGWSRWTR
mmetsp:Transcript_17074/g.32702  ORF Transcript_17074/g.32702 Transcript_17074/m.32702 type:complete len:230 (-) Transcript_17074:1903-2592(-)